jgi:hypothetical protein
VRTFIRRYCTVALRTSEVGALPMLQNIKSEYEEDMGGVEVYLHSSWRWKVPLWHQTGARGWKNYWTSVNQTPWSFSPQAHYTD